MRHQHTGRDYMRFLLYALLMLLCFLIQTAPQLLPRPFSITAVPLLPLVVCIGVFESDATAAGFGLVSGLLMDVGTTGLSGFNALALMAIGCAVGLLITFLFSRNFLSTVIITTGALLIYLLLHWLCFIVFAGHSQPLYYLVRYQLPVLPYTLLFFFPLYFITKWIHRKLKPVRLY